MQDRAVRARLVRCVRQQGGFARAYQAAALLLALMLVRALADAFPQAWMLSSLLFVWAGAGALAGGGWLLWRRARPGDATDDLGI